MSIRFARPEDETKIRRLYREHYNGQFDFPSRDNTIIQLVAEKEDKAIGYGLLKTLSEAFIILDKSESGRKKIEAISELIQGALMAADAMNIEQIHAFVEDPKFASLLKKHFSFKTYVGEALVLDVR